jgi:hypothetical protein
MPDYDQYIRKVRLECKGSGSNIKINHHDNPDQTKIEFEIEKSISSTQNTSTIKIWNLKEETRNALGKELDEVILEAGYTPPGGGDNTGILFQGNIRDVSHTRDGAVDIVTILSNGDGDKAIRSATTSKSYPKGTKVETVVEDLQKDLEKQGVKRGEQKLPENLGEFKRPYATVGSVKNELDTLSRGKGFYWSIQNNTCEIIPGDGYIGGIILLNKESGLVDVPTITDNGVKITALINPDLRPNRRVKVESSVLQMNAANGEYRISEATYSGDNRSGDFFVAMNCESIKGDKVDEGKKNEPVENTPGAKTDSDPNPAQTQATTPGGQRGDT